MSQKTTTIILALVIVAALLAVAAFSLTKSQTRQITDFESCVAAGNSILESYPRKCIEDGKTFIEKISDAQDIQQAAYFVERFPQRAIEILGAMPIEGFNPELYKQVYPKLQNQDFHNTEAIGGLWKLQNNQLTFVQNPEGPISSADGTLTEEGLATLLDNIAERLKIQPNTEENIDRIISSLE